MIKMAATMEDGRQIILLAITEMNVTGLREGKPIMVHAEEVGLKGFDVWLTLGKDEETLRKQLAPLVHPERTTVIDHRDSKKN